MIFLREYTSAQIVNKSRASNKFSRYNSRTNVNRINVSRVGLLDIKEGSKDLNIYLHVTSASDPSKQYRVDLKLEGFIDHLKEYATNLDTNVTIQKLIQNLRPFFTEELKKADVKVNCTCPDFTYRFKDSARNEKFYFGIDSSDEARNPNPNKINPNYEGSVCKHIIKVLTKPSLWYEKVIRSLSNVLKNHQSTLAKTLDVPYN